MSLGNIQSREQTFQQVPQPCASQLVGQMFSVPATTNIQPKKKLARVNSVQRNPQAITCQAHTELTSFRASASLQRIRGKNPLQLLRKKYDASIARIWHKMKSHSQILFSFDLSRHYHMHEYVAAYQYIYGGANDGGTFCVVLFWASRLVYARPFICLSVCPVVDWNCHMQVICTNDLLHERTNEEGMSEYIRLNVRKYLHLLFSICFFNIFWIVYLHIYDDVHLLCHQPPTSHQSFLRLDLGILVLCAWMYVMN